MDNADDKNKYTNFDLHMSRPLYFNMLEICLARKLTIDEFVHKAISEYLSDKDKEDLEETINKFTDEGNPNTNEI
jgi:hypothetical protein